MQHNSALAPSPLQHNSALAPSSLLTDRRGSLRFAATAAGLAVATAWPALAAERPWLEVAGATLGDLAEPAVTFVDCEDHFAIEYSKRWSRTQPLPAVFGGAGDTRFAATDFGSGAVVSVTRVARRDGDGEDASALSQRLLEARAADMMWERFKLTSCAATADGRVEFEAKVYYDSPDGLPVVRRISATTLLSASGTTLVAWASAPADALAEDPSLAKRQQAMLASFRRVAPTISAASPSP